MSLSVETVHPEGQSAGRLPDNAPRVAVIGAGLAGLACAQALRAEGIDARVFEKSRGAAGRMSTRIGEGWQCDHGAQYFTARDPAFRAEVARWCAEGVAAPWAGRIRAIDASGFRVPDPPPLERFVGVPGMTAPARRIAAALPMTTQCEIRALRRDTDGWRLRVDVDDWLPGVFDALVLAVPGPQAGALLEARVPDLAALARNAPMRGAWALMLRYDAPLSLAFDAAFVNHGPLRWVARDSSKPQRGGPETWLLHATPQWSASRLEDAPDKVVAPMVKAFKALGAPDPGAWTAHRWRYADTEPPLQRGCIWDPGASVGLCGDWLDAGKVEGAWLSGRKLARAMSAALRAPR